MLGWLMQDSSHCYHVRLATV